MNSSFSKKTSGASQAIETFHSKEYTLFVSQIGFAHPGQVKVIFEQPSEIDDANLDLQAILLAGRAKIASLEGNFHLTQKYFEDAFLISKSIVKGNRSTNSVDVLAYVEYEYGLFLKLLYDPDQARMYFTQGYQRSANSKLNLLIEYQLELISIEKEEKSNLNRLIRLLERIERNKISVMYILGLQRLGILSHDRRDYKESERYYKEALFLAEKQDLQYLVWTIKNSIGLLLHKQGKYTDAVSHYESFIHTVDSHYLKSIVMKNLALRYGVIGKTNKAIELSKEALEHSQTYGVFSEVPGLALLTGKLVRDYSDTPSEAFHYFKLGYDSSIQQQEAGLPISGPRLRAIREYADYVTAQLPERFNKIALVNYFEWAKGKSWVRIQDLFHYNFFVYHFIHTGIGKKTFDHLKMIPTTFYSLAKRMRDLRGISFPDLKDTDMTLPPDLYIDSLQRYVQLHRDKTFQEANAQFERDIYEYLFKESGYNKKLLSKSLDLSYSVVLKHTKEFTQASETFTQPQLEAPR